MLGLTLGGVSSSSPVAVSVPSQPGENPSRGGHKGWGPAASGEGECVGAAPLSRAGPETRKQMVPAGPAALLTWLKLCPCNSRKRKEMPSGLKVRT